MRKDYFLILLFLLLLCNSVKGQIPILEFNFTRGGVGVFSDFSGLSLPGGGEFSWIEDGATVIDINKLVKLPEEEKFTYSSNDPEGLAISIDQKNALVKISPERGWFGNVPIVIYIAGVTPYSIEKIKENLGKEKLLTEMDFENLENFLFDTTLFNLFDNKVKVLIEERTEISYEAAIKAELEGDSMNIQVGDDVDIRAEFYPGGIKRKPKISIAMSSALIKSTGVDHCSDGIQNYDETEIDCGGSCLPCEEKGFGVGLIIFVSILLILLVGVYLNVDRIKGLLKESKKKKKKKIEKPKIDFLPVFLDLRKKVTKKNVNRLFEKFSDLYRDFFGQLLDIKYEFTYDELKKELRRRKMKVVLKKKLLMLAQVMSDVDYGEYKLERKAFDKLIKDAVVLARAFRPKLKPKQKPKKKKLKKKKIR